VAPPPARNARHRPGVGCGRLPDQARGSAGVGNRPRRPIVDGVSRENRPRRLAVLASRRPFDLQAGIVRTELWTYLAIGVLLVAAAGLTLVGTVVDVIEGSRSRPVSDVGVFLLERILLIFIIAELLYTLRLVDFGGRILVEPFLFIAIIAVVRRILLITAEAEAEADGAGPASQVTGFLIEIGALGALTLALAVSIYLLRRSGSQRDESVQPRVVEAALRPTSTRDDQSSPRR
jgi:uncharacterized membrane protein (DUF373 family)